MIRSLLVAEQHPWPPRGGIALRNAANAAGLAAVGSLTIVGVGDAAGLHRRSPLGEHHAVGLGHAPDPDPDDDWARRDDGHPSDSRWSDETGRRFRAVLGAARPEIVVVEQLWLYRFLDVARETGARLVLDAHNVESEVYAAVASAARDPAVDAARRRLDALMARRTAALEAKVVMTVDQVWACSERDRQWFLEAGAGARVVPNVVDVACTAVRRPGRRPPLLVYPASFAYPPNVKAARTLIDEVLPRFAGRVPGARLALVGHSPPRWLRDTARVRPDVDVTGPVESIAPWLGRALAMVVPLQEGSGTRFKVLEAMAAGVPVVSTSKGIEGLALTPDEDVLVGGGPSELADLAVSLRTEPELADRLAVRARATVERHYSWRAAAGAIRAALT